jgi:hypothetical protein
VDGGSLVAAGDVDGSGAGLGGAMGAEGSEFIGKILNLVHFYIFKNNQRFKYGWSF